MPLPRPRKGQKESGFISSCMSSEIMKKEFPEQKNRLGVCYSLYRKNKKNKESKGSFEEPFWDEVETDRCLFL